MDNTVHSCYYEGECLVVWRLCPSLSLPDTREDWTKTLHSHILIPGYNYLKGERIGNPIHDGLHHLGVCTPHKQEKGTFGCIMPTKCPFLLFVWGPNYPSKHLGWISRDWKRLNDNVTLRTIPPGSGKWTLCKTILTMSRQTVISIHSITSTFLKRGYIDKYTKWCKLKLFLFSNLENTQY